MRESDACQWYLNEPPIERTGEVEAHVPISISDGCHWESGLFDEASIANRQQNLVQNPNDSCQWYLNENPNERQSETVVQAPLGFSGGWYWHSGHLTEPTIANL